MSKRENGARGFEDQQTRLEKKKLLAFGLGAMVT